MTDAEREPPFSTICGVCGENYGRHSWRDCPDHNGGFIRTAAFVPATPIVAVGKDTNPKDAIAGSKVALWLLSPIAKAAWAVAMFAGQTKYGAWNWRISGVRASVYLSAMHRHMDAYVSGEELDPIDGTPHLGNIMACCAIILDAQAAGKLNDDRPPRVSLRPMYEQVEATMKTLADKYADKKPKHYTIADTEKK